VESFAMDVERFARSLHEPGGSLGGLFLEHYPTDDAPGLAGTLCPKTTPCSRLSPRALEVDGAPQGERARGVRAIPRCEAVGTSSIPTRRRYLRRRASARFGAEIRPGIARSSGRRAPPDAD
jgi:hypothetical protein